MIELAQNQLVFHFPEIHEDARCTVEFQRTLRIPDDNREYALPPGLGRFPICHVDDHKNKVPDDWVTRGGVFLPMYQAEALWINFSGSYPFALKIAAGKINAVSGESWSNELSQDEQDYVVIPGQPWLDGFSVDKGKIRQFVAMPLGEGYTAEEQITGTAEHGGIQVIAYPMKAEAYNAYIEARGRSGWHPGDLIDVDDINNYEMAVEEMGLAPGGLMRQEIYEDPFGKDTWDTSTYSRCFIHIVNSMQYHDIVGEYPPHHPPSAADYTNAGLPWFDYYDAELKALPGSETLAGLDSVAAKGVKKNEQPLDDNQSLNISNVNVIKADAHRVREWEG